MGLVRTYSPAYQRAFVDALGEMRGEGAPWSPANDLPIFWLDGDLSKLVGSSPVTSAGNAAGGALVLSSGSTKPNRSATLLGGHHGFDLTATSTLYTTSGGVSGAAPFTQYAVGRLTPGGSTYGNLVALGVVGALANTLYGSAIVGTYANTWWGGGNNGANTFPSGGTANALDHVFMSDFDGKTARIFVDGLLIASHANAFVLTAGFGICNWYAGAYGTTGRLYSAVWRAGQDSPARRRRHVQYLATRYGLTVNKSDALMFLGDSLTYGLGSTTPATDSYPSQLASYLSGWTYAALNTGVPGATAEQIADDGIGGSVVANGPIFAATGPGWVNNITVIFAGTNDGFQHIANATTTAQLASMKATLEARGYVVVFATLYDWLAGGGWDSASSTLAAATNAWILANIPATNIIRFDLTPEMQIVSGAYQATYRNSGGANIGHPTTLGYTAMARDAAAVLLALRQT